MSYVTYVAQRSLVGSGTNLLAYQETFSSLAWVSSGGTIVTTNFTVFAPDVSGYAVKFIEDTSSGPHGVKFTGSTSVSSTVYTLSVYAQAAERNWMRIGLVNLDGSVQGAYYNVGSGVVGAVSSGVTATISDVGSLWFRAMATITISGNYTPVFAIRTASNDNVVGHLGVASLGMYWWGAMANVGAVASTYPHTANRTYALSFDTQAVNRSVNFVCNRNLSIGGAVETILQRQEVMYDITTQFFAEGDMNPYREFLHSTAGGESFLFDVYGSASSAANLRTGILESSNYAEQRRGSTFYYSLQLQFRDMS